ncbi:MAG: Ada metal-binding domain-containing protein, partial [Bdellovibrionota bacterium]
MSTSDSRYKAMLSRDARFDGRFFIGVKTTGIYCRPICPARPKRSNVEFFSSALAAERAGYRPCLRCRPECAPGSPGWMGTSALVSRVLKRLASGETLPVGEDEFAELFGVSARHLRRLFKIEIGKSPKQIADEQRLGFARQLVVETSLPFTEVAEASGFASLRRFNSAFKDRFKKSPTEVRRRKTGDPDGWIELSLSYRPPFDFATTLEFHRRHAMVGLEDVTADSYRRLASIDGALVLFEVTDRPEKNALRLRVRSRDASALFPLARRVRAMFDLDSDPIAIQLAFAKNARLKRLVKRRPGLR